MYLRLKCNVTKCNFCHTPWPIGHYDFYLKTYFQLYTVYGNPELFTKYLQVYCLTSQVSCIAPSVNVNKFNFLVNVPNTIYIEPLEVTNIYATRHNGIRNFAHNSRRPKGFYTILYLYKLRSRGFGSIFI